MVRHDNYHSVTIALCKVEGHAACLVKGKKLIGQTCGVISMGSPVNLGAFHKEEETVFVLAQLVDSCASHLGEGGLLVRIAVYIVIHIYVAI